VEKNTRENKVGERKNIRILGLRVEGRRKLEEAGDREE
jgi:hypothetical protein